MQNLKRAAVGMEIIKSGLRALWKILYPLMVYYLSVFAVGVIFQTWGIQTNTTIDMILPGAALTLAILWFPYKRDWILRQGLIKKPVPTPVPMWEHLVILGVAASIAGNIIISLTPLTQWFPAVEGAVAEIDAADWLQQVIGVCLIIPAAEEMVFRGIGYGGLRDEMGPAWAALFSALFFGAFHGNLVQGIYAGLLGLILAFIMERYHSMTAVWLTHAATNAGSLYVLDGVLMRLIGNSLAALALVGLISLAVTVCEIRFIGRNMPSRRWKLIE